MAQEKKEAQQENTGFGKNAYNSGGRFLRKDGKPNVEKRGVRWLARTSFYHTLLDMSIYKFLVLLLLCFVLINLLFAMAYMCIGVEQLMGVQSNTFLEKFAGAYFFSAQTFTTVGYGHISPKGFTMSAVAASEALVGLLSFAIATGLFYGRFSKPRAHLKFSHNALISPFGSGTALMLRLAPFKNNNLTDAEVKLTLGISDKDNPAINKFYQLDVEFSRVNSLNLSWTIVHPITENSPLYSLGIQDFKNRHGEILVFVTAFDEMFSSTVAAKTSYTFDEVIYGAKFDIMFKRNEENTKTILYLNKINDYTSVNLN